MKITYFFVSITDLGNNFKNFICLIENNGWK